MFHKGFGNRFTEPRARRSSIHGRLIGRMKIGCPNIPLGRYWDPLYPISFCWCESRLILVIQLNQGVLNYFRTPWAELNNCISSYLQLLHFSYRSLFANVLPEQVSSYILLCPSKPEYWTCLLSWSQGCFYWGLSAPPGLFFLLNSNYRAKIYFQGSSYWQTQQYLLDLC